MALAHTPQPIGQDREHHNFDADPVLPEIGHPLRPLAPKPAQGWLQFCERPGLLLLFPAHWPDGCGGEATTEGPPVLPDPGDTSWVAEPGRRQDCAPETRKARDDVASEEE